MSFVDEFKKFAIRGNAIDLAVGVIIGATFGKIVSSLVNDVLMPPLGLLIGGVDFSELRLTLKKSVGDTPPVTVNYGTFINSLIDFIIVAVVIFVVVKIMNKLMGEPETLTKDCPACAMPIPKQARRCGHCCKDL